MRPRLLFTVIACVPLVFAGRPTLAASLNGSAGVMPAYYDGHLFTINFKQEPAGAERSLLAHNGSINTIFMSDAGLPDNQPFVSVLDAIQGDGFNPLWVEKQITFNSGFTPRQLTRDDDIAAAAASGEITLASTGEVYRCAVVGPKAAGSNGSLNGSGGDMPAYYDGKIFTINFKQEPAGAEGALLAHNGSINTIFMSDAGLPGGKPFVSVLDAIQGDGFNPLWVERQIAFNSGFTPRQLTRDDDILAAAASGEITLSSTGEVYRCAVVGTK